MPVQISESLQRRIGPLPAWGWGAAIGGGLLAVKMLRGGSILGTRDTGEPVSSVVGNEDGAPPLPTTATPGPPGPAGKDAPKPTAKPACSAGQTFVYDPVNNAWHVRYVSKPPDLAAWTWQWDANPVCDWKLIPKSPAGPSPKATVVSDAGAKGPSMLNSDLGGPVTQTLGDFSDTPHLAPPDMTPKSDPVTVRSISLPRTPTIASSPSNNGSGTRSPFGRPHHGN